MSSLSIDCGLCRFSSFRFRARGRAGWSSSESVRLALTDPEFEHKREINVKYSAFDTATSNIQHPTSNIQHPTTCLRYVVLPYPLSDFVYHVKQNAQNVQNNKERGRNNWIFYGEVAIVVSYWRTGRSTIKNEEASECRTRNHQKPSRIENREARLSATR